MDREPKLRHRRRGAQAASGYIPDDQQQSAILEPDQVVPVPADLNSLDPASYRAPVSTPDLGQSFGQERVLQGLRDRPLLRVEAAVLLGDRVKPTARRSA